MISTPTKPTMQADQRRTPTCSPRNGIDSTVRKIGPERPSAMASDSGSSLYDRKKQYIAETPNSPRSR